MDYEEALERVNNWQLGQTSERHESGGRGPGTISSGRRDHGGKSYGSYQLSSRSGTLREYLDQSPYGRRFEGLEPGSPAFDARWKEIAVSEPAAFRQDQHEFIGRSHYEEQLLRLEERGIDLRDRGIAMQDALWSTSVQFRNLTTTIVTKGIEEKFGKDVDAGTLTDRQIIEAMQDYKIAHNNRLFRSSPTWWPNLLARAADERDELLQLERQEAIVKAGPPKTLDHVALLTSPTHPHHTLYTQTLHHLHAAETTRGIAPGPHSEHLAAALTVSALEAGLGRVDRVEFNDRGTLARVVQASRLRDEPGLNLFAMPVDTARGSRQPLQASSEQARAIVPDAQTLQAPSQPPRTVPAREPEPLAM